MRIIITIAVVLMYVHLSYGNLSRAYSYDYGYTDLDWGQIMWLIFPPEAPQAMVV